MFLLDHSLEYDLILIQVQCKIEDNEACKTLSENEERVIGILN